jgi:hypothetical protein
MPLGIAFATRVPVDAAPEIPHRSALTEPPATSRELRHVARP